MPLQCLVRTVIFLAAATRSLLTTGWVNIRHNLKEE